MKGYNDLGITVRYLAYPRQGGTGEVASQMAKVWCSDDPNDALDRAKSQRALTGNVSNVKQCETLIEQQYNLGRQLGISGTPAIYLSSGKLISGYLPPAGLYKRIQAELGAK